MGAKSIRCLFAAIALLFAQICRGAVLDKWEPIVFPWNQLFPSIIITTATLDMEKIAGDDKDSETLGEQNAFVGARITAPRDNAKVRVVVSVAGFMRESEIEVTLPRRGTTYEVFPEARWDFDALVGNRQTRPVVCDISVSIDGQSAGSSTKKVPLRSVNDCLWGNIDPKTGEYEDLTPFFAAYVNEDHPLVSEILRDALESRIVTQFDGYQSDRPQEVTRQVFAIWNVLQRRGFRYSSITETAGKSDKVFAQHVRLFDDSVNHTQANCVDGSVLFASVLRKIGIDPLLICVPGHMYVAYFADKQHTLLVGLETTMMGGIDIRDSKPPTFIDSLLGDAPRNEQSWNSFYNAIVTGSQNLAESATKIDARENGYCSVDVDAMRKLGFLPIPFAKSK